MRNYNKIAENNYEAASKRNPGYLELLTYDSFEFFFLYCR